MNSDWKFFKDFMKIPVLASVFAAVLSSHQAYSAASIGQGFEPVFFVYNIAFNCLLAFSAVVLSQIVLDYRETRGDVF